MLSSTYLVAAVAVLGPAVAHASPNPVPVIEATLPIVEAGCYKSLTSFKFSNTNSWQTSGLCQKACVPLNKPVIAINGTDCWCSNTLPPTKDKVDESKCDTICPGFGTVMCGGGADYFTTWNDGLVKTIKNVDAASADAEASKAAEASKSAATQPSVVTNFVGGQTVVVTQSSEPSNSGGPNKAGIAAGVVVGIVVLAAAAGGMWFFMRARSRRELEEAHRRQAAINSFVKTPSEASAFDTRLEPAIMRRMSAGSIADNQDYSRRILKVTNA